MLPTIKEKLSDDVAVTVRDVEEVCDELNELEDVSIVVTVIELLNVELAASEGEGDAVDDVVVLAENVEDVFSDSVTELHFVADGVVLSDLDAVDAANVSVEQEPLWLEVLVEDWVVE